jgi:hypothetical protein
MRLRSSAIFLVVALAASTTGPAFAQSPTDDATSRALFDEGRKLMEQGNFAAACPKLEEGQRLSPGIGMKFNLAECYERLGKLASAWAAFLDVAALSKSAGQMEREAVARRRARALEFDLVKIEIDVPASSRLEGLEVRRDGALVGAGQWGSPLPADPGTHVVTATAPGRIKFERKVEVSGGAGTVAKVALPLLDIDPRSTEKSTSVVAVPQARSQTPRTIGYVAGAAGLGAAVAGAVFGIVALNKYSQSSSYCYPGNQCRPEGVTLRHDAIVAGNLSTIALVAAAVLVAGGVGLIVLTPSGPEPSKTGRWLGPLAPAGMAF